MEFGLQACLLVGFLLCGSSAYPFEGAEIVYPERIGSSSKQRRDLSTRTYHGHEDNVLFQLNGTERDFVLVLKRNSDFHTPSILVKTFDSVDNVINKRHMPNSCHYHGKVRGETDSNVLISTCNGLSGVIETKGDTYYLEPKGGNSHVLYKIIDDNEFQMNDMDSYAMINEESQDTMDDDDMEMEVQSQDLESDVSVPSRRDIVNVEPQYLPYLTTTAVRYCETYVVVDHEIYQKYGNDTDVVIERVLNAFHSVDRAYSAINIRIVIVAIEIWTNGNKFERHMDNSVTEYESFGKYWKANVKGTLTHDSAQLLSHSGWSDGVGGRAALPGICRDGVGINGYSFKSVTGPTIVLGHEMGHNFNFPHDADMVNCTCLAGDRGCFMGGSKTRRPGFTTCNMERLAKIPFSCLNNYPKGPFGQTCGNGIIEAGEQCDCGTVEMCQKMDPCCQPGKCMLKMSAQCSDFSTPECCNNCNFKFQGTLCRPSKSNCDVNEYCTGSSPTCPTDEGIANGTSCSDRKILLRGPEGYRKTVLNFLHPKITARYVKISPHKNKLTDSPCLTLEILASDSNEALANVATPITTRDLYYTGSLCVTPNITDCSNTKDVRLIYKRMPFGNCNHPHMQFKLESDGTLRHVCTNKVICPDSKRHLYLQDSCSTPGDEKYERTAERSIKHKSQGRCFLSSGGWPNDNRYIYLSSSCDLAKNRSLHDFLIPDSLLPVGMEDGSFPDSGFSSNAESTDNKAKNARYRSSTAFCFKTKYHPDAYLKIDLGSTKRIGGIEVTSPTGRAVTGFYVDYSLDDTIWESYSESGATAEAMNSFCSKGRCVPTVDNQCKDLWDSLATKADDKCWNTFNTEAKGFGTCDNSIATPCSSKDKFCGQLQCTSPRTKPLHIDYAASYAGLTIEDSKCSAANITDKQGDEKGNGMGMVLTGTKCGDAKVCKDHKCVSFASAGLPVCPKVDDKTCAGRGTCLNNGKCSCDSGYDPKSNCELELVPRDGKVGQWSSWSLCQKGCGGGIRMRARFCDSPYPVHGGKKCADTLVEEEGCNDTPCPVGYSCRHIQYLLKDSADQLHDGIFNIKLHDGTTMPVYCDMTRNGGGWTLILSSHTSTWNNKTVFERNKNNPAIYKDYSIINYADSIKDTYLISSDRMEYKLEAQERGKWGGVWSAPSTYLFKSTSSSQTDVILKQKFSKWDSESKNKDLASRMPFISGKMVSTANEPEIGSRGSLTDSKPGYAVARWMAGTLEESKPEHIWYWMREGAYDPPHSCREIKLRGLQMDKVYTDGVYSIQSKTGQLVKTYCDMTRHGGGWTLMATAQSSGGFTADNLKMLNADSPSLSSDYSILGLADDIKGADPTEDYFHYMIEATGNDRYGGVFSAPVTAKLANCPDSAVPKLLKQFDTWDLKSNLAKRIPSMMNTRGMLFSTATTNLSDSSGVLIRVSSSEGSYLPGTLDNPSFIRFWIREGVTRRSCNDIKVFGTKRGHKYTDGYYTIKHLDAAKHEFVMPVYCDMTSDPGAWTLLVTSRHNSWTANQVLGRNIEGPSVSNDYSILKFADKIKDFSNDVTFKYKLAAQQKNRWGGIFSAPKEYSFLSSSSSLNKVSLLKQFDDWTYNVWSSSVNNRMPWLGNPAHGKGLLTTSGTDNYYWYGTIISANDEYNPAPWINAKGMKNPGIIWYYVNEDDCNQSRTTVNGGLSPWSVWSQCSSLCSAGTRRRTRSCYLPKPRCGGASCPEDEPVEVSEACQGICPASAIKTSDDRYCLMPENGTCSFENPTRVVWRSGIEKCSLSEAKFVFVSATGSLVHQCSGIAVCPKGGSSSQGTELVIDPACPKPTPQKHILRTHQNQLSFIGRCVHSYGGYAGDGIKVVLWSGSWSSRLVMDFYELPKGNVQAKYFMKLNVSTMSLDAALYADPRYPSNPSSSGRMDNMELPSNTGGNYGAVLSSYFIAPLSGPYLFHTACNHACDLYMSSSTDISSKVRIVRQEDDSDRHSYREKASQTSEKISLVAGKKYYMEVAMIEGGGNDHLSVAMTLPDGGFSDPITSHHLAFAAE